MVQQPKPKSIQLADSHSQIKFILYNLAGLPKAYYRVDILPMIVNQGIIPLESPYSYQVLVLKQVKKICGGNTQLELPSSVVDVATSPGGLTGVIYKFKTLSGEEYLSLPVHAQQNHPAVYGFAKAQLEDGNFNLAKYALKSSCNATLCDRHLPALSNTQLLTFADDLEQLLFHPEQQTNHIICKQVVKANSNSVISVAEVMEFLTDHRQYILLNLQELQNNYERTGIKQVESIPQDGESAWLTTEYIDYTDGNPYVRMRKVEYNRHKATMNLLIERRVRLVKAEEQTPIPEIAGVFLDNLNQFKSYTIVRDRQLNIQQLCIKISNKSVFTWLRRYHLIAENDFDFEREYTISLLDLPLVKLDQNFVIPNGIFEQILTAKVLMSMIKACLKNESMSFVPQQVKQLKSHYLSPNLYLNIPREPELNRFSTLVEGSITTRQRHKIELGNSMILHLGKLKSANQFLNQRYYAYDKLTGEIFINPNLGMLLSQQNIQFRPLGLTKRSKIKPIDMWMGAIFDEFLGLAQPQIINQVLAHLGETSLIDILPLKYVEEEEKKTEIVSALTTAYTNLSEYIERTYRELISPLVFYIGTTGFLPESLSELMGANIINGEELVIKYPNLQISRDEMDGLFFEVGNYILSIYPQIEYYSH